MTYSSTLLRVLALTLLAAGVMHLWLAPQHLEESRILGAGFIAAAIAQLALGLAAITRGMAPYRAIALLNAALVVLYVMHVTVGLPLPDVRAGEGADEGVFGVLETVDPAAVLTKLIELAGIVCAVSLGRTRRAVIDTRRRRAA